MAKQAVDAEYLSDVWTRINTVISEQKVPKCNLAKKCGFERKTLSMNNNISITYFARLCEELNVSADFFLFGLEKTKEKTSKAAYFPDKCYKDMPTPREIIKETKKMMKYKGNNISMNNMLGISAQKELMTLADDFGLLEREEVKDIIENCTSYKEGQRKIMEVYEKVYIDMSEKEYKTYKFINNFIKKYGYSPSYREIAANVGCSLATASQRIEKLIGMGKIKIKSNCPRSISVVR